MSESDLATRLLGKEMDGVKERISVLEQDFKDLRSIVNQDYKLFKGQLWDLSGRVGKVELALSNFLLKGPNLKETNFQEWVENFDRRLGNQKVRLEELQSLMERSQIRLRAQVEEIGVKFGRLLKDLLGA